MTWYTKKEIQQHKEIFVREVNLFCMTFRFYVYKDSNGEYTNLALYKYYFDTEMYEELNVYFIDWIPAEELDNRIKADLREYLMRPLTKKYIARYVGLLPLTYPI